MTIEYTYDADGRVFINKIPLTKIEEAQKTLHDAGLFEAASCVSWALAEMKPVDVKPKLLFICASCCADGIKCGHKSCHQHPTDCRK